MNAEVHLCSFLPRVAFCFLPLVEYGVNPADSAALSETGKSRAIPTPSPGTRRHTGLLPAQLWLQSKCFPVSGFLTACARHGAPDPTARVEAGKDLSRAWDDLL